MNKLMQMMVLIDCLFELGMLKHKSNAAHRFAEIVNFVVEGLYLSYCEVTASAKE